VAGPADANLEPDEFCRAEPAFGPADAPRPDPSGEETSFSLTEAAIGLSTPSTSWGSRTPDTASGSPSWRRRSDGPPGSPATPSKTSSLRPAPRLRRLVEPHLPEPHLDVRLGGIGRALPGGTRALFGFPPLRSAASIVLHHHDRWGLARPPGDRARHRPPGERHLPRRPDGRPLPRARTRDLLDSRAAVRDGIARRSKSYFSPELVSAFMEASLPEAFWLTLEPRHIDRFMEDALRTGPAREGRRPAAPTARRDLRARRRREEPVHGPALARRRPARASSRGLLACPARSATSSRSPASCTTSESCASPTKSWKNRRPSTPESSRRSPGTAFETYQILRRLRPFRTLAVWASFHHESLSGRGYPFHRRGLEIPFPARRWRSRTSSRRCCRTGPTGPRWNRKRPSA